jgi:hypothetical protein
MNIRSSTSSFANQRFERYCLLETASHLLATSYSCLIQLEKIVGEGSFGKALLCRRKKDSKKCIIKQVMILFGAWND